MELNINDVNYQLSAVLWRIQAAERQTWRLPYVELLHVLSKLFVQLQQHLWLSERPV